MITLKESILSDNGIKESILSDMDDTLQAGDNYAKDIENKFKKFSNELVNTKNYDTRYMVSHSKGNKFGVDIINYSLNFINTDYSFFECREMLTQLGFGKEAGALFIDIAHPESYNTFDHKDVWTENTWMMCIGVLAYTDRGSEYVYRYIISFENSSVKTLKKFLSKYIKPACKSIATFAKFLDDIKKNGTAVHGKIGKIWDLDL